MGAKSRLNITKRIAIHTKVHDKNTIAAVRVGLRTQRATGRRCGLNQSPIATVGEKLLQGRG